LSYVNEVIDAEYNIMPMMVAPILLPIIVLRSYAAKIPKLMEHGICDTPTNLISHFHENERRAVGRKSPKGRWRNTKKEMKSHNQVDTQ
jgi:hypothetical protein